MELIYMEGGATVATPTLAHASIHRNPNKRHPTQGATNDD